MNPGDVNDEMRIEDLLGVLWAKKWFILCITCICLLFGFLSATYTKPLYQSSALLMPPFTSEVATLNETDLELFTGKSVFKIYINLFQSNNLKHKFFKIYTRNERDGKPLPPRELNQLFAKFSQSLKITPVASTENFKVVYTSTNPTDASKIVGDYIKYVNAHALTAIVSHAKKYHQQKAAHLLNQIIILQKTAVLQSKAQEVVLNEALAVAELVRIEQPLNNIRPLKTFDPDPSHLYFHGSKALKALLLRLNNRTNYDAFYPKLNLLKAKYDFYKNFNLKTNNNVLYLMEQSHVPSTRITFSTTATLISSLLIGLLISFIIIFAQYYYRHQKAVA